MGRSNAVCLQPTEKLYDQIESAQYQTPSESVSDLARQLLQQMLVADVGSRITVTGDSELAVFIVPPALCSLGG